MVARKKSSYESKKDRTPPPSSPQTPYETQTIIKNAVPNVEERRARFGRMDFKLTKEQRGLRRQPILITAPPPVVSPYTLRHRKRVFRYTAKKHVQRSDQAELPRQTVVSPPILMGTQSMAASESALRASYGREHARATAPRANQRHSGGARGYGIEFESQGPPSALPHPIIPSLQAAHPPNLSPAPSSLVDRPKRSYHRDRRTPNFPRRLGSPYVDTRQRPTPYDKPQAPVDTSKRIKAGAEASAPRATGASASNAVDLAFGHLQPGVATGWLQSGASYVSWTGTPHFGTTASYPTFSDGQRRGVFTSAHIFDARYSQEHLGEMALAGQHVGRMHYPQHMQRVDASDIPVPRQVQLPPHAPRVAVKMGSHPFQPALQEVHSHAGTDARLITAAPSSRSRGDPTPSFHRPSPERQSELRDALPGSVTSTTHRIDSGRYGGGTVVANESDTIWTAQTAGSDEAISLELQPASGSAHEATARYPQISPLLGEKWRDSLPLTPPQVGLANSEDHLKEFRNAPKVRMSTYSSLDGAVSPMF
ncbi:uncharacterized protein TRAVEDRAFT_48756 [Trametes versicolor FP-101664 SS1]|uniref:uncharacterized protein n=1 Tax=Trametes versicolor (strain FP-101664) TaxID=717944 RepID=UPI00046217B0|nr:uncharacterized protein TRAVEDRAFT_48756 [Trametes versicolor FP-101664 SS1]EIW57721.1 hypothetical protein TRAVEDRAFT_48756 [Trametes versicolor FP-101664 SS1]